eukprot:3367659-Amphidinium_carterae.1
MLNTLVKVLARVVAEKLSGRLSAVLHEKQNGFLLNRGTGNARSLPWRPRPSSLRFSEPKQVVVLLASGCSGWILNYLEEMLVPFSSSLDWRSQRSPWIQITSGLLQGHPRDGFSIAWLLLSPSLASRTMRRVRTQVLGTCWRWLRRWMLLTYT